MPNSNRILYGCGPKQVRQIRCQESGFKATVCCCITAAGNHFPPTNIFLGIAYVAKIKCNGKNYPRSLGLAHLSGWIRPDVFPTILKYFISYINVLKQNTSVLILDNHYSHITLQVMNTAGRNGLSILIILPH